MIFAIFVYAFALVFANFLIITFGPSVSPINSFFFIGLDITMRDWLHVRLKTWQMIGLIIATGAITYIFNPSAAHIAIASSVSFTAAALVDWGTFAKLKGSWVMRSNGSNVASAAIDSLLFPTIAFGVLMPHIVVLQFCAKLAGGAMWSLLIARWGKNAP